MAYPRFQRARQVKRVLDTGTDITVGAGWAVLSTTCSVTLAAQVGDVLRVEYGARFTPSAESTFDAVTVDGAGAIVSYMSGNAGGTYGWAGSWVLATAGHRHMIGAFVTIPLVAADLVSGTVTVRVAGKGGGTLYRSAGGMHLSVQNLGPLDPN